MKNAAKLITFLMLLLGAPLQGEEIKATVRLIERAYVTAPEISLGEIAHIETENAALHETLKNFPVDKAPRVGRKKMVSAYRLRGMLEEKGLTNVEVVGLQALAKTEEMEVPFSVIEKAIRDYAQTELPLNTEIKIDFPLLKDIWKAPLSEDIDFQVSHRGPLGGRTNFKIEAKVMGETLSQHYVMAEVTLLREVAVLIRPVSKGDHLTGEDFEIRPSDVSKTSGMELASGKGILNMVAIRDLPIGTLLKADHFDKPVVVQKGAFNRLLIVNGSIRMQMAGVVALENGKEGEVIRFKNPFTEGEVLRAKVLGPGRAVLKLR